MGVPLAQPTKQARHSYVADGPASYARGEELAVTDSACARSSGHDGVMASPPAPRRRWLLEGAGAAFQHVLTACLRTTRSVRVTYVQYDQANTKQGPS